MKKSIVGNRYGKWKVLNKIYNENHKKWYYICECQCYFKTISTINKNDLVKGKTVKCKHCSKNEFIEHNDYYAGITVSGESFYFDKHDYDIAISNTWHLHKGYVTARKNGEYRLFHREVIKKDNDNILRRDYIDHINKNKADNRRLNLRVCNSSINQENRKIQKNTTGYKGIKLLKNKKYQVKICKNYQEYYLGTFETLEEAINARKIGEKIYHKETFRIMDAMEEIELDVVEILGNQDIGMEGTTGTK